MIKMKGAPSSCFVKNGIMYKAYTDCLDEKKLPKTEFYRIGSCSHQVSKFLQKKACLISAFDDKRYMMRYES